MSKTEILKKCFGFMDLTTLKPEDTQASVKALVDKVSEYHSLYPDYPLPASICVYPNFAHVVKEHRLSPELHVTTVAGCFPTSQSFLEVKKAEVLMAIEDGADEIDIVLALNAFLAGDEKRAAEEISQIKQICAEHSVLLKVILETGLLGKASLIKKASILAMYAGADYIKTSTGKEKPAATPEAAYVMCQAIKEYYEQTGIRIGFKPAGGMNTIEDALVYYTIVKEVLGEEWLTNRMFRLGTSRLCNLLINDLLKAEINYF